MLSDAVEALIEDDDDLAADVMQRDDDVDRLWYMASRVFRTVLRNPTAANEIGFPRETVFDFQSSARPLGVSPTTRRRSPASPRNSGRSPANSRASRSLEARPSQSPRLRWTPC